MKTKVLVWIFLFLVFKGYSQIPQSPNSINSNGQKDGEWTILFNDSWKETKNLDSVKYYLKITFLEGKPTGIVKDYYSSGKIQWEGKLKSIDPQVFDDGLCTWYFENGNIKTKVNNINGKGNGEYKEYFSNGKDSVNGFLKDGYRDNLFTYYYPSGNIWSKMIFHQDTVWDLVFTNDSLGNPLPIGDLRNGNGYFISYFINGNKSFEGNFKNGIKDGLFKDYNNDGSYCEGNYTHGEPDGKWIGWDSNGNKKWEHQWANGIKDGIWKDWFDNGQMSSKGEYKNDLKEGLWKEYEKDGSWWEVNFIDGKSEAKWVNYDKTGMILTEGDIKNLDTVLKKEYEKDGSWWEGYYINGKPEGKWIDWYSEGKKKKEVSFVNGKREGLYFEWLDNGSISSKGEFKNDLKEGLWKVYQEEDVSYWVGNDDKWIDLYSIGKTIDLPKREHSLIHVKDVSYWEGIYINGEREGKWIDWDSEGKKKRECSFVNGKREGKWIVWYSNGKKKGEYSFINDKSEGLSIDWFENGKKLSEGDYKNDLKEGLWTEYNEKGEKFVGKYVNGKKEGEWRGFGSDGIYRTSFYFKNGEEQK